MAANFFVTQQETVPKLLQELDSLGSMASTLLLRLGPDDGPIGMTVEESAAGLHVSGVVPKGAAARAGVAVGDRIVRLNGESTASAAEHAFIEGVQAARARRPRPRVRLARARAPADAAGARPSLSASPAPTCKLRGARAARARAAARGAAAARRPRASGASRTTS